MWSWLFRLFCAHNDKIIERIQLFSPGLTPRQAYSYQGSAGFNQELTMTPEELKAHIDECLSNFPFEKVAGCYLVMDHKWSRFGRPPTAAELRAQAEKLFARIATGECVVARMGGLCAEVDGDGLGGVSLLYKCGWTLT